MQCGGVHFQAEGTLSGRGGQPLGEARVGWLVPKSQKLSHRGSGLANEIWGASVLGRGNLGRARKAWPRERVEVALWLVCKVGTSLTYLYPSQSPLFFQTLCSSLPSLILHYLSLRPSGGLSMDGMWWWVVVEKKRLAAARPSPVRSPIGLTVFLTTFQFICFAAPSRNCLNCEKYLDTY